MGQLYKNVLSVLMALATIALGGGAWMLLNEGGTGMAEQSYGQVTAMASLERSDTPAYPVRRVANQDTLKTSKASAKPVRDFRLSEDDVFASLRDETFFTTDGVEELVPEDPQSTFRPGQKVYVFAALHTPKEERVRFTWYDEKGGEILPSAYFDVEANTGPVGYRIFSYRSFRHPGDYKVAVFNSAGREIGSTTFVVK